MVHSRRIAKEKTVIEGDLSSINSFKIRYNENISMIFYLVATHNGFSVVK